MAAKSTSIKINGKHYDARSGALLPAPKSIDGVIGTSQPLQPTSKQSLSATTTAKPKPVSSTKKATPNGRSRAVHASIKRGTASKTLMRHAVRKPQASLKRRAKAQTPTHSRAVSRAVVTPKTSLHSVDKARSARALQQTTHPQISRFSQEVSLVAHELTHEFQQATIAVSNAIVIPQTYSPSAQYKPDVRRVRATPQPPQSTSDIFEEALLRATSHEELPVAPAKKQRRSGQRLRRRFISLSAGAVAVIAIIGVFGLQQHNSTPQFTATTIKSSFSGTVPGYQPSGYVVKRVQNTPTSMDMQYSNANKTYTVNEKQTTWSEQNLLEKLVGKGAQTYASLDANGKTVYTYGNNQAAWIHNGILYQVAGNGVLSTQDFTQIASSM